MLHRLKSKIKQKQNDFVNNQNRFVFTHVPKCAGSSLSRSLLDGLYPKWVINSPLTTGINIFLAAEISQATGLNEQKIRQIHLATYLASNSKVFVTGHCYAPPELVQHFKNKWNFLTVLRHPVDRFISEYVYNTFKKEEWQKNSLPFEDYIADDQKVARRISYARFFSGMEMPEILENPELAIEKSVNNLKQYYKIGFLDNLSQWVEELNNEFEANIILQKTNSSPNKSVVKEIKASESNLQRIEEICDIDIKIYEQILKHCTK